MLCRVKALQSKCFVEKMSCSRNAMKEGKDINYMIYYAKEMCKKCHLEAMS
jgi:hypothetical protein